jgi:hypothetical protein
MKLQTISFDLVQQLLAEDVPEAIAKSIGTVLTQKNQYSRKALHELFGQVSGLMAAKTGLPLDKVEREIDQYLVDKDEDPWYGTIKPEPVPEREPTIRRPKPPKPTTTRSENEHDWETVWHDTLERAYEELDYFRPSALWGRGINEYFPDTTYFVFDVGGPDGWYTIAAPQTRSRTDRETGGLGLYLLRKRAHTTIPHIGVEAGMTAQQWLPKVLDFLAKTEEPTEYDSPSWKVTLRNILMQTGLGRQTGRNEHRNDRIVSAFTPAESFDQLNWGNDPRLESRIPDNWRALIDAVSTARKVIQRHTIS